MNTGTVVLTKPKDMVLLRKMKPTTNTLYTFRVIDKISENDKVTFDLRKAVKVSTQSM